MIVTIFRSHLDPEAQKEYRAMAKRMSVLARTAPGYVSHKGYVADDGKTVAIVEFESENALREWKANTDHLEAKRLGFSKFFTSFKYQVCNVLHVRAGNAGQRRDRSARPRLGPAPALGRCRLPVAADEPCRRRRQPRCSWVCARDSRHVDKVYSDNHSEWGPCVA